MTTSFNFVPRLLGDEVIFPSECQQNLVDDRSKYLLWRRYTEPKLSVKHLQVREKKRKIELC